jgi:hypothetical protein
VVVKGNDAYPATLEMSYIDVENSIVYVYDSHGYINVWNYRLNTLEKIATGFLDKMPQDREVPFNIPEDFKQEKDEQIISSGSVDSQSFYLVTCHSLRLITRTFQC